jgi:hypothetical protein
MNKEVKEKVINYEIEIEDIVERKMKITNYLIKCICKNIDFFCENGIIVENI